VGTAHLPRDQPDPHHPGAHLAGERAAGGGVVAWPRPVDPRRGSDRSMKVGVNLINFGPAADPSSLARWSGLAETLGYHFLMISDHVAITPDVQEPYPAPFYDPFVTLGWLAGLTRTVELGTTVILLPYRHPLL